MPDEAGIANDGLGAPAKRGRGRPRKPLEDGGITLGDTKSESGASEPQEPTGGFKVIDPFDLPAAGSSDGSDRPRARRGRKPKSDQKEEAVSNLTALLKIERLLVTGCFFLGNIAGAPELHITGEEAAEISEALKDLSKHYPIGMSEKSIAWVNLSFAVGGVFGPKVIAVMQRPRKPGPQRAVQPIRETQAQPAAMPAGGPAPPVPDVQVPSQLWPQPTDIDDDQ